MQFFPPSVVFLEFSLFLIRINRPINIYDEGIIVYGAYKVLTGEIPYKDFWTLYAPGQFYIIAGLFKIFGVSILVERLWDTFVRSLLSLIVFLTVRKLASQTAAFISWFAAVMWFSFFGGYGATMFPALLLSLISVWSLIKFLSQDRRSIWLVASGISVGIATLFRHDFGFYIFIAETLWMFLLSFFYFTSTGQNKFRNSMKLILPYSLGVFATLSLPTLYFMKNVSLWELAYNLVIFPTTIFPSVRSLPFPAPFPKPFPGFIEDLSLFLYIRLFLDRILFYFPLLVYALAVIIVVAHIGKQHPVNKNICAIMLLVLVSLGLFNYVRIRSDVWHLLPLFILAFILIFPVLRESFTLTGSRSANIVLAFLASLAAFAYIFIVIYPIGGIGNYI